MTTRPWRPSRPALICLVMTIICLAVYWPGLYGAYIFDDYPNVVDNTGVQPKSWAITDIARAAMSSPSSEMKRPLASVSFAINYLITGQNPFWMKLTNLVLHVLNGLLAFVLARLILKSLTPKFEAARIRIDVLAGIIAFAWLILPINLTAVLYVVQRMESLANLFVFAGLAGYTWGRLRERSAGKGTPFAVISVLASTVVGVMAKETAVLTPLYAFIIETFIFRFRRYATEDAERIDHRLTIFYVVILLAPMIAGLAWLLPVALRTSAWATRNFTLATRLLSEARIVPGYLSWTIIPTPHSLSFYNDDFVVSTSVFKPWTTAVGLTAIAALLTFAIAVRKRLPLVALGICLFLGAQTLTGTIIPLELVFEHRNYFASFGILLAVVPLLAAPALTARDDRQLASMGTALLPRPMALARRVTLALLIVFWTSLTAFTAYCWGNPLRLAEELASRAPRSPRALYELGRAYIIASHYNPASPYTKAAYDPLERAALLPGATILPEQALIFMNARMHISAEEAWWTSLIGKLANRVPGVQDESSLGVLAKCEIDNRCDLPHDRMVSAMNAALSHPTPSARLLSIYGDYAWNAMGDQVLGESLLSRATASAPSESAYRITLARMQIARREFDAARESIAVLRAQNIANTNGDSILALQKLMDHSKALPTPSTAD